MVDYAGNGGDSMGLLFDEKYWAAVTNTVFMLRPVPGAPISRDDAVALLETACTAFSDLTADPELEADVDRAVTEATSAQQNIPTDPEAFRSFVEMFERAEKEVLSQAGVSMEATEAICRELSGLLRDPLTPDDYDRLPGKIDSAKTLVCEHAGDPGFRNDPEAPLLDDVRDGVIGISAVGIDCVAVLNVDPATGLLIGQSVGVGLVKFRRIWRRRW